LRLSLITLLALTVLTGVLFALWPELDLMGSAFFHGSAGFAGNGHGLKGLRGVLYFLPVVVMGLFLLAWILGWVAGWFDLPWPEALQPRGRSVLFLALGLALGPGLLVNAILKEHWDRPRPLQVQEFGGPLDFRPWYETDGACVRNCSFVSGETSGAFWLAAPASLAPPPLRLPAMAAALGVGALTGGLRVAFGGHFLSDALFAGLFTLILVALLRRFIIRPDSQGLRERDPHL
jgi:membrane-associated phospholipid phosphatase